MSASVRDDPPRPAPSTEPAENRADSKREFRPDIQALRAIAVMAVVFYHLWPFRVRGGYVGVDVFFVISGFLITRHLSDEVVRTGRISLTQFWARRIRRLLPAAFLVLLASLLMLLLLMPRVTWQNNFQEIAASASYVENWLLGFHAVDYLAAHNSASLVQHYWSLSAEEQFYLGWPILLLVAIGAGRLVGRRASRSAVRLALTLVGVASFLVSVWYTAKSPAMAFFATPTRAWEFAAGGILSLSPSLLGVRAPSARAVASWAGLGLIGFSVFLITGNAAFPGWIAAVPVAGAALVLAGGTSTARWSPAPIFRIRAVQWLGNYSYSIYLWHWPLIIVAPWVLGRTTTWSAKLVILVLSLVLAFLTKKCVEDPIRTGRRWRVRRWPAYAFTACGMAVFLVVTFVGNERIDHTNRTMAAESLAKVIDGAPCYGAEAMVPANHCPDPYARPTHLDLAFAAADFDKRGDACQQNYGVTSVRLCAYGQTKNPTRTVVVVGNSHAVRLIPALDLYGKEHGWSVLLAAKTDCLGVATTPTSGHAAPGCLQWSINLQKLLLSMPHLSAVVFASHLSAQTYLVGHNPSAAQTATAQQAVLATWRRLDKAGIPVVVTQDVPGMRPQSGPQCIAQSDARYDPCAMPRSKVLLPNFESTLAAEHPELVDYVRVDQYFCDASTCHALIGGVVVYTDSHHLTSTYSQTLGRYLGPQVAAAMERRIG